MRLSSGEVEEWSGGRDYDMEAVLSFSKLSFPAPGLGVTCACVCLYLCAGLKLQIFTPRDFARIDALRREDAIQKARDNLRARGGASQCHRPNRGLYCIVDYCDFKP